MHVNSTDLILTSTYFVIGHRRPSGIDEEFFVQLFVEPEETAPVVDTQMLLSKMFQEQSIAFTKVC